MASGHRNEEGGSPWAIRGVLGCCMFSAWIYKEDAPSSEEWLGNAPTWGCTSDLSLFLGAAHSMPRDHGQSPFFSPPISFLLHQQKNQCFQTLVCNMSLALWCLGYVEYFLGNSDVNWFHLMGALGPKGALAIWCSGRGEDTAAGDGSLDELKLRKYLTRTIAVLCKI